MIDVVEKRKLISPIYFPRCRTIRRYLFYLKSRNEGGLTLNKNDLIAAVADQTELSKADTTKAVDAVIEAITKSLKKGTEVRLVGFGTFSVARRKATTGRNPRTGETIQIKASNQPKFKAGKALKDAVN